ncbi:hypothetical protein HYI19_08740 [Clostridium botulinum]|uniref:Uncharacterized protein n=1 Tax=Clostridium botulinum TaxID=1491 RepID=A0A846IBG5_CLOBO|nr:hypothetical protein [Clostridium botulinum]AJE10937.1 hypothetical protein T259_2053 [Clostridium botulinum CDC_1436]MBD5572413.1 hypothetical protein [Clostridium botulinum]MBO0560219.1 hypothetical protein [Clostridium botulinum]MBY6844887.1 hypothetical protein [Clostridium botulinum]NEZ94256.1 hypothetical protein [Clostridium botulinum]
MQGKQLKWDITYTGNEVSIADVNIKIKELYGGFGRGQKILTVPQIASLHVDNTNNKEEIKTKIKRINELINNNIILESGDTYFEFGIDIIDLKSEDVSNDHKKIIRNLVKNKVYTQNSVNRAKNLYILSEQGYSLLINLMKDTRSKIIYKRVIRDYFRMKELVLNSEDTEQYMLRLLGKKERKRTTDTIKYFIDRGDLEHDPSNSWTNAYAKETNYIYKIIFGMTAKQIEAFLGVQLKNSDTVRNYLCMEDIEDIRKIEGRVAYMMEDGKSYEQIHERLKELYPKIRQPKLAGKDINIIRKLMYNN